MDPFNRAFIEGYIYMYRRISRDIWGHTGFRAQGGLVMWEFRVRGLRVWEFRV